MSESDWEEYYRNINAFNIPNADAKRVEIWDKAFLSTKTVRETLWDVYSKGFMDGVNDQAERYKDSAYRQKHDSELLDRFVTRLKDYFVIPHDVQVIEQMAKELKAEVVR